MKLHARIEGLGDLMRNSRAFEEAYRDALAAGLYEEGQAIFAESQEQVPVDTGRLRSSGYVAPPEESGSEITVEIGYGTEYAIYVHERTELRHPTGKARYLSDPLQDASHGFRERLAKRTLQNLRAGRGVTPLRGGR